MGDKFNMTEINLNDLGSTQVEQPKAHTFMFVPSEGKDMKSEYSELANVDEFKILNNREMIFVWLLANETSPYSPRFYKDRNRAVVLCLKLSKLEDSISQSEYTDYINRRFPTKLSSALKRMRKFDASARMRAKLMSDKMFTNLERIIELSDEELKAMSLGDRKAYAGIVKDVNSQLQDLVTNHENNFGIKEIQKKKDGSTGGPTLMDKLLSAV